MSEKRERERAEVKEKGIPIADLGAEVIFDDLRLKVPFSSIPFISKMKGRAFLEQTLSYGLYFNELTQKWTPITATTMGEALVKGRYYPTPPSTLTELSDNPLRSDNAQNLMTVNPDFVFDTNGSLEVRDLLGFPIHNAIKSQIDKLSFLDTTKLSVKDDDLLAKLELVRLSNNSIKNQIDLLSFLDTTKLSVKDNDLLTKLELVRIINDAIKTQTELLTFLDTTKLSVKDVDVLVDTTAIKGQTDKLQFDGSNNLKCIIG